MSESVLYECPTPVAFERNSKREAKGKLRVTTSGVVVVDSETAEQLIRLPASQIFLSGTSRKETQGAPCLYCRCVRVPAADEEKAAGGDEDEEEDEFDEVRLVPDDASCLDELHQAVCRAMSANPMPGEEQDSASDDDDGEGDDDEDAHRRRGPAPCLPKLDVFADAACDHSREIGAPIEEEKDEEEGSEQPAKVARREPR